MATYRAVNAACEAVVGLLKQAWQPKFIDNLELQFQVFSTLDFNTTIKGGSLFLYRVFINSVQRTPSARIGPNGSQRKSQLPLDLHFLLTPWADKASLEQDILGWMMRTLEDTPILSAGFLDSNTNGVFMQDERIEIVAGQLTHEEMFRIWDVLPVKYKISVPYIARIIRIDLEVEQQVGSPIYTKELGFGDLKVLQ